MVRSEIHGQRGKRSALGPRGRGLLGRMFGGRATTPEPSLRREASTVAIASGKGGTGKSFLATSLSIALQQRGRQSCLIDCDFGLACDHLLLGVTPQKTLQNLLLREVEMRELYLPTPAGPTLVPGSSGVVRMASLSDRQLQTLAQGLGVAAADFDCCFLDVGAGIAAQNMLTLLAADHIVLVTNPEIAALTDAYAVIKAAVRLHAECRIGVVVNRVATPGQGGQTFAKLAEVAQRHTGLELEDLGEIPEDPKVTQRRLRQEPLLLSDPEGKVSKSLREVLRRLEAWAGPLVAREVAAGQGITARFQDHRLFLS